MTLPLCVLGAGAVHVLCIAALVPVLVTVPAPRSSEGRHTTSVAAPAVVAALPAKPRPASPANAETQLVTGSIAQAASTIASAIARMPREDLRQAQFVPTQLTSVDLAPDATLAMSNGVSVVLANADVGLVGVVTRSEEEIGETARRGAATHRVVVRAKPKAAAAATPRRRAAAPVRRDVAITPRRPVQTRVQTANQPLGLGLLFRKPPQPMRRPGAR